MPDLAFPTSVRPAGVSWRLRSNTQKFESPLNRAQQTLELPGSLWGATLTFSDLKRSERAELQAFLIELNGMAGRFTLWNHAEEDPRGTPTGAPAVKGIEQTSRSLLTDNWGVSSSGILLRGDYFGVNGELKMITADVDSDAAGEATLTFSPLLRNSPADNDVLTFTKPTARMMLIDDEQADFAYRKSLGSFSIECIEAPL